MSIRDRVKAFVLERKRHAFASSSASCCAHQQSTWSKAIIIDRRRTTGYDGRWNMTDMVTKQPFAQNLPHPEKHNLSTYT